MTSNAKGDKLPLRVNPHYPGMIMQGDDDGFSAAYAQAYSEKGLNEGESKKMANERANLIVNAVNAKPLMTDGRGERGSENHSGAQETGAAHTGMREDEAVEAMCDAYDAEVDYLGDSAMERYCNDVPMRAAYRALLKHTKIAEPKQQLDSSCKDSISPLTQTEPQTIEQMEADIMKAKEALIELRDMADTSFVNDNESAYHGHWVDEALAALDKYGDKTC